MCSLGSPEEITVRADLTLDKSLVLAKHVENADVNVTNRPYGGCHRGCHTSALHLPQRRLSHHHSSVDESVIVVAVGITQPQSVVLLNSSVKTATGRVGWLVGKVIYTGGSL